MVAARVLVRKMQVSPKVREACGVFLTPALSFDFKDRFILGLSTRFPHDHVGTQEEDCFLLFGDFKSAKKQLSLLLKQANNFLKEKNRKKGT